jgi:hypothetical protein
MSKSNTEDKTLETADYRNELPEWYTPVSEPFFSGKGEHSVYQLEDLCEAYKEFSHQSALRIQYLRSRLKEIEEKHQQEIANVWKFQKETAEKWYTRVDGLRDFLRKEILERRDYSASKAFEIVLEKINKLMDPQP